MGLPQIILIILATISFTIALTKHGQPRNDKYNIWTTIIGLVIEITLLIWGGFFS